MKRILFLTVVLSALTACGGCGQTNNKVAQEVDETTVQAASETFVTKENENCFSYFATEKLPIGNMIGFVRVKYNDTENLDLSKSIIILDDDDTVWMSFSPDLLTLPYEKMVSELNPSFKPWMLSPEFDLIAMRCVAESDGEYSIIVDERSGLTKRLKKHPRITFDTIAEHLMNMLIGNDYDQNPMRTEPSDDSEMIIQTDEYEEIVADVNGDWIRLMDVWSHDLLGWVRWKNDGKFAVEIYYGL